MGKIKVYYPIFRVPESMRELTVKANEAMARLKEIADVDNSPRPTTKEAWIEKLKDVNAVSSGGVPRDWTWNEILDAAPKLWLIQTASVGYNQIDVDVCTERGVLVCNVPEDMSESVAQHALALILDVSKKVTSVDRAIRRDRTWVRGKTDVVGFELWGKTLGMIGLGNIGGRIAMKLRAAFNMRVIAYDPFLVPSGAQRYGATLVDLPTLLKESDVINVSVLLTKTGPSPTYHLLGAKEFDMMKKTAILVNTARGAVIDEVAIIAALKEGKIAAAGLDVFEIEPINSDNPLLDMENVVLTAHQSSSTREARIRTPVSAIENIMRYARGERPFYIRNRAALYVKN
jgi:lactate dehydrogenase-like 2-hydroxyacid dehydrogenase